MPAFESLIVSVPDFPEPGIVFRDITPLLADAAGFRAAIEALIAPFAGRYDYVAGIEARGFILAAAASIASGTGLIPIRKSGRLPRPAASVAYSLEYADAVIEAHDDVEPGARVLLLDDVLATGGTLRAARELLTGLGADVIGTGVLIEIEALGGRAVAGTDIHAVLTV